MPILCSISRNKSINVHLNINHRQLSENRTPQMTNFNENKPFDLCRFSGGL